MAYSRLGPHRLELIEALPGTFWDAPSQSPIHHLGYWCADVPGESEKLTAAGSPLLMTLAAAEPGRAEYVAFHRLPDGTLVELVDAANRQNLEAWFAGAPHPGPHGAHVL